MKTGDSRDLAPTQQTAKEPYLLDTSAILTLLESEPGADRVEEILRNQLVLLPFVVRLEVYYITAQEKGEQMAGVLHTMLKSLKVTHFSEINEPTLLTAGRFKAHYQISLADALIAAFAVRNAAILVHKDPEYEVLKDQVAQELLPYKKKR